MHEPLLAEEEPLPTPPESPFMNELDSLRPGSSSGRTPSPSPGIINKEEPKLLSPGSWNEDKTSKCGGSKGSSKPNSRPSSRPTTPSTAASAPTMATTEGGGGPSRTTSRQSSKNEQGSDLEIKPLQRFDSEVKGQDFTPAPAAPVRNSLISPDEEEAPQPTSKVSSRAVTPEPKTTEGKTERATPIYERAPSPPENKVESREVSRPSSKAETKPLPKRQPSPAPSPKPAPRLEPKPVPMQVEAKAIVAKPTLKVEPKAEARLKAMVPSPIHEEALELEVRE